MMQFYFLSILLNIIAGLTLVYAESFFDRSGLSETENDASDEMTPDAEESKDKKSSFESKVVADFGFLNDKTFRLVTGILSALVGIMKLLSTVQNDVIIIGDLFPAVAGILAGASLLFEFYSQKSNVELKLPEFLSAVFIRGRKYLGVFCIIAGVLHFVFPRVLFL